MKRRALCFSALLTLNTALVQAKTPRHPSPRPQPSGLANGIGLGQRSTRRPMPPPNAEASSLQSRLGLAVAERLLKSDTPDDRVQAIDRLGAVGTPRALELLVRTSEAGTASARERLAAVRALFPHARRPPVRQVLVRLMVAARTTERRDPLEAQVRRAAALALAASREKEALLALASALRQEGPVAETAREALLAHPPVDLQPLLSAGRPSATLARTLGHLGDQRAFSELRLFVRHGSDDVRIAAAVSLTLLGDLETEELARNWLVRGRTVEQRIAAAEMLAMTHSAEWPRGIMTLLADSATRDAGIDLAARAPHPQIVSALARQLTVSEDDSARIIAAIGRAGGVESARLLGKLLSIPLHASAAAYALALAEGDAATEQLERALTKPSTRILAARAAVVRSAALGRRTSKLERTLEELVSSTNPEARALGAWGLGVLDRDRVAPFLRSSDAVVVRAVARLALRGEVAQIAAERLVRETDGLTRTALAACLLDETAAALVPTRFLERLARLSPAAAPVAVRALAMRDDEQLRPRLESLLDSDDVELRTHTALGLGYSKARSVVGLLLRRYATEPAAGVRGALLSAVARQSTRSGKNTLWLAAMIDPDHEVRERARVLLAADGAADPGPPHGTFWLRVSSTETAFVQPRAAVVAAELGVAIPVVSDPGGFLALTGLPEGPMTLRLADEPEREHPFAR